MNKYIILMNLFLSGCYLANGSSINKTAVIANRGSAGLVNEFLFTGFERFRAWINAPVIFGASNATRDKVQILKKIDEYNAQAVKTGK
ncbi:hypothetical protein BFQ30_01665 [Haemophilus quentini]|uniref:Lipoprotein n=1 Tax=Haemophilus quentini TaxID=123834 RepID=A0ABX3BNL8_9PAST|nr:hypothetical protein [Haemophilus quentini]EGT81569.1 putative lipoprotein [Haemophilus haemolyticus M21639]OEY74939.1 hypothetical protein BFQ29_02680 [Haemophilus quentini]OEY75972.1 hypothetical protein BFQ30_01665 [Haemophilus quentini]ORC37117.1 hypothetical protein BES36_004895 [Haemophilus quentini]